MRELIDAARMPGRHVRQFTATFGSLRDLKQSQQVERGVLMTVGTVPRVDRVVRQVIVAGIGMGEVPAMCKRQKTLHQER